MYRETIRRLQVRLTETGFFNGRQDGRFTEATKTALGAYQAEIGFESTGFPDQATLWRLFRETSPE